MEGIKLPFATEWHIYIEHRLIGNEGKHGIIQNSGLYIHKPGSVFTNHSSDCS